MARGRRRSACWRAVSCAPCAPTEEQFTRTYGPWRDRTPDDVREFLVGYDGTWFVAGGWAIEAFTGASRPHGDCDISVLRSQVLIFTSTDLRRVRLHVKRVSAGRGGAHILCAIVGLQR